jgi:WD40 repeat protein
MTCTTAIFQIDLASWTIQRRLSGSGEVFNHISISQDGHLGISSSKDGLIRVWDIGNESVYNVRSIDADILNAIDISSNGEYLLLNDAVKDGLAKAALWDIDQTEVITDYMEFSLHTNPGAIKISPDSRFVGVTGMSGATGYSIVRIWDFKSGKSTCTAPVLSEPGRALAFSPNSETLLAGTQDLDEPIGKLVLVNIEDCKVIRQFNTTEDVSSIAFSSDGNRAVTGSGFLARVILWDVATGKEIKRFAYADRGPVNGVAFGPGDGTVLGSGQGEIYLWNIATGNLLRKFTGLTTAPLSLAVSPDGRYVLSGTVNGELILWDYTSGEELHRLPTQLGISSVLFSPDSKTAYAAAMEGKIIEWPISEMSLPELLEWIKTNRYVRELTCEERQQYRIDPQCKP